MAEKCRMCFPDLKTLFITVPPTEAELDKINNGLDAVSEMMGCGKNETICEPIMVTQREFDKLNKEAKHGKR